MTFTLVRTYYRDKVSDLKQSIEENKGFKRRYSEPLKQYEKIVYNKMVHLQCRDREPIYDAYVNRTKKTIKVFDEKFTLRINRFSKKGPITLRDRSSGEIDLKILLPFMEQLKSSDIKSIGYNQMVTQDLFDNDTYINTATFYNGFQEGEEDQEIKMEEDTDVVRFISDFSSIPDIDKIIIDKPKLYYVDRETDKKDITKRSLKIYPQGVYIATVYNMKRGETLMLDFNINWEYLKT